MKTKAQLLAESVQPGAIVFFNNLDDAAPFEVISRDHYAIVIRDLDYKDYPDMATQQSDVSLVTRIKGENK